MTNLDSILKSRDITLPKKIHLVKAMVFPVVMYGCESWTVNPRRGSGGGRGAPRPGGAARGAPPFSLAPR